MSCSYSPSPPKKFPPLLRRLVRAAEAECPPGHAEALVAFISLALSKDSAPLKRCPPSVGELPLAIQSIARAHFEVDQAIAAWRRSLAPGMREGGEADASSFYAGLVFGLLCATHSLAL